MTGQADQIADPRALIEQARLAAVDTELASHQAAAMIVRLADALEAVIQLGDIANAGLGSLKAERDDAYDVILQTLANLSPHGPLTADDRALFERVRVAVQEYEAALPGPAANDWPAQQRRIAARIAERYEEEAP